MTNKDFKQFFNPLSGEDKELFRMLQRAYQELGQNRQMFSYSYMGIKQEIRDYVMKRYGYDLEKGSKL